MAGVIFIQWEHYRDGNRAVFFEQQPLTFNSRQERLHCLAPGDRLWLVSRCPDDQQYYFVAVLHIAELKRNAPETPTARMFGEFAVVADHSASHDLGTRFRAEGFLRALQFDPDKPIKYGASIGQSLQALRLMSDRDASLLDEALRRVLAAGEDRVDTPVGLWTKCDRVFANYFLLNWHERQEPLAFLLYDPPPALPAGSPVFIHSDKQLRLVARFLRSEFVAGHKFTAEAEEREAERERVWRAYRASTISPPAKADFDRFWVAQHGVRSLFVMDRVSAPPKPPLFNVYGRALEWGYPTGVGYRYLSLSQTFLLLRLANLPEESASQYMGLLTANSPPREIRAV